MALPSRIVHNQPMQMGFSCPLCSLSSISICNDAWPARATRESTGSSQEATTQSRETSSFVNEMMGLWSGMEFSRLTVSGQSPTMVKVPATNRCNVVMQLWIFPSLWNWKLAGHVSACRFRYQSRCKELHFVSSLRN